MLLKLATEALLKVMQMANNGSTDSLVTLKASIATAKEDGVDAAVIEVSAG